MLFDTKASLISVCFGLLMVGAAGFSALGCNSDLGIEEQTYQCATDAECGDGLHCRTGQCADIALFEQRCEAYCDDFMEDCNDSLTGLQRTFARHDRCVDVCKTYPINGNEGATEGNSLQCRLYHLELASLDRETHCPHASPEGTQFCGDTTKECLVFCFLLMDGCTGENRQFETPQHCLETCAEDYRRIGGRLACRRRYASDAAEGLEVELSCRNATAREPKCD